MGNNIHRTPLNKSVVVAQLTNVAGHALTCKPNRSPYAGPGEPEAHQEWKSSSDRPQVKSRKQVYNQATEQSLSAEAMSAGQNKTNCAKEGQRPIHSSNLLIKNITITKHCH